MGSSSLTGDPGSLPWECGVLATGPPGIHLSSKYIWSTNYEAVNGLSIKDTVVNKKNTVLVLGDNKWRKMSVVREIRRIKTGWHGHKWLGGYLDCVVRKWQLRWDLNNLNVFSQTTAIDFSDYNGKGTELPGVSWPGSVPCPALTGFVSLHKSLSSSNSLLSFLRKKTVHFHLVFLNNLVLRSLGEAEQGRCLQR